MKKTTYYTLICLAALLWAGCKKGTNYPGGQVSQFIPLYDLRELYKGADLTLSKENMYGSDKITGIVVSDYTGKNLPDGLLMIQDKRRLSQLRGITIPIGADADKYVSGDSVTVEIAGSVLTRANGTLQLNNVPASAVTKVSGGNAIAVNRVASSAILADPSKYESTLVAIVKGGFDPLPTPTDKFSGDRTVNDGFENITLHTETGATFANNILPVSANFFGVVLNTAGADGKLTPQIRLRKADDVQLLSSTISITPIVVSGFINDVSGTDGNYEYIQLLATQDIDFAKTPFSVVVTNNAGASVPTGFPANGWATGGGSIAAGSVAATMFRTFKFNLTTGTAQKGTYFYVGGAGKTINGSSSTSIASSNWIRSFNYTTTDGDGFGARNGGFFANSGNAFGMAVFSGTTVTKDTQPIDVLFVSTGGSLFSAGPPAVGYKIANTDFYDVINPVTLQSQPYYRQGSNTMALTYTTPADQGFFYKLGGTYNPRLGKWVKARTQSIIKLSKTSAINEIEGVFPAATATDPGVAPTNLKD
jgi:PBP1b-binding outer membrane lipoprotein LpoB